MKGAVRNYFESALISDICTNLPVLWLNLVVKDPGFVIFAVPAPSRLCSGHRSVSFGPLSFSKSYRAVAGCNPLSKLPFWPYFQVAIFHSSCAVLGTFFTKHQGLAAH
jgi:hypothetical protein